MVKGGIVGKSHPSIVSASTPYIVCLCPPVVLLFYMPKILLFLFPPPPPPSSPPPAILIVHILLLPIKTSLPVGYPQENAGRCDPKKKKKKKKSSRMKRKIMKHWGTKPQELCRARKPVDTRLRLPSLDSVAPAQ